MNKFKMKVIFCITLLCLSQSVLAGSFSTNQSWISYFWEKNTTEPLVILYDWQTEAVCTEQAHFFLKDYKNDPGKDWSFKCNTVLSEGAKSSIIILTIWKKINPDPIMLPVVYDNKTECMKQTKEFNKITLETIKKERNFNCKKLH